MPIQKTSFLNHDLPIPGLEPTTIGDFWRWAYSDILSNGNRAVFAEFIVGVALGCADAARVEWDAVDLRYGDFKIEVKASAYCQSWHKDKPSKIVFSVREARVWVPETGKYVGDPTRFADTYVFCCYPERDRAKADVLDIPAWDFYVMSAHAVNSHFALRKSVALSAVQRYAVRCKFDQLRTTVDQVLESATRAA